MSLEGIQTEGNLKKRATQEYTANFLGRFRHEFPPERQAQLLQGDEWLDVAAVAAMTLENMRIKFLLPKFREGRQKRKKPSRSEKRTEYLVNNVHALIGLAFLMGMKVGEKSGNDAQADE